MAEFGKLNFSTAFNPTSGFPLDARCYFESLEAAEAAAATAEDVGSTNTIYHYGMKVLVNQNGNYSWYTITNKKTLEVEGSGSGTSFTTDETLTLSETGVLSVNTATDVESDNTLPITSAAVHTVVGNIEALLGTI